MFGEIAQKQRSVVRINNQIQSGVYATPPLNSGPPLFRKFISFDAHYGRIVQVPDVTSGSAPFHLKPDFTISDKFYIQFGTFSQGTTRTIDIDGMQPGQVAMLIFQQYSSGSRCDIAFNATVGWSGGAPSRILTDTAGAVDFLTVIRVQVGASSFPAMAAAFYAAKAIPNST